MYIPMYPANITVNELFQYNDDDITPLPILNVRKRTVVILQRSICLHPSALITVSSKLLEMGAFQAEASSSSASSTLDVATSAHTKYDAEAALELEPIDTPFPYQPETPRSPHTAAKHRRLDGLLNKARSQFPFLYQRARTGLLYLRGPRPKKDLPGERMIDFVVQLDRGSDVLVPL